MVDGERKPQRGDLVRYTYEALWAGTTTNPGSDVQGYVDIKNGGGCVAVPKGAEITVVVPKLIELTLGTCVDADNVDRYEEPVGGTILRRLELKAPWHTSVLSKHLARKFWYCDIHSHPWVNLSVAVKAHADSSTWKVIHLGEQ